MREINKLEGTEPDFPYQDILYLEHPTSHKHPRQEMASRACQFAPFAALTGFDEQIREVQRYTSKEIYLDEYEKNQLDQTLSYLIQLKEKKNIKVTYFVKDLKKEGGSYCIKSGLFYTVNLNRRVLIFEDRDMISLSDIVKIEILDSSNMDNLI